MSRRRRGSRHEATSRIHDAAPLDGRGHRSRQTELLISERDKLLVEAAKFYPGCGDREVARRLRAALSTYRNGRFRRDRSCEVCPAQHKGKLVQVMWLILKNDGRS